MDGLVRLASETGPSLMGAALSLADRQPRSATITSARPSPWKFIAFRTTRNSRLHGAPADENGMALYQRSMIRSHQRFPRVAPALSRGLTDRSEARRSRVRPGTTPIRVHESGSIGRGITSRTPTGAGCQPPDTRPILGLATGRKSSTRPGTRSRNPIRRGSSAAARLRQSAIALSAAAPRPSLNASIRSR